MSRRIPSTHRLAERELIACVKSGEWEVDEAGRIWRLAARRGRGRHGSGVRLHPVSRRRAEKLLPNGYLMVRASLDGRRVVGAAHRLVWQHFVGDIPPGLVLNHINGEKADNRPSNLEVVTYSENARHARRVLGKGDQRGEANPSARITEAVVLAVRHRRASGEPVRSIADDLELTEQQVSRLARGDRWAHVGGPLTRREVDGFDPEAFLVRHAETGRFVRRRAVPRTSEPAA